MMDISRQRLVELLSSYAAQNPELVTLTGDEFIIKPRRLGTLMKVVLAFTVFIGPALLIVMGLVAIMFGLMANDVENPGVTIAVGIGLFILGSVMIVFFVVARMARGTIDLRTGDYVTKGPFWSRTVLNMADVVGYHRVNMGMNVVANGVGPTVSVICQLEYTVPEENGSGTNGSKSKQIPLVVFNKAQSFTEFEPVVNALIGYFRYTR